MIIWLYMISEVTKHKKTAINVNKSGEIPVQGTLGILAYGYKGIMAWRRVRYEHAQKIQAQAQTQNVKSQDEEN